MINKKNPEVLITAFICLGLMALVLWVYYGAVFGVKAPVKKKEISVVLYDAGDGGWESLVEGMKQAEEDFAVNIHYVTARTGTTGAEQAELIRQEVDNGAGGILLAAVDAGIILPVMQGGASQVPVVAVESNVEAATYAFFSADNVGMGRRLGEEILRDFSEKENLKIVVVEEFIERDSVRERAQGLYEVLADKAEMIPLQRNDDRTELTMLLSNVLVRTEADAVVALCKESLHALCKTESEVVSGKKIYGIGNTATIVAALEKEKIEKLVFQDEFNIGYMGVKALVQQMEGIVNHAGKIDYYCVSGKEIHETQYERLLFPIVE